MSEQGNRTRDRALREAFEVFKTAEVLYVPDTGPRSQGYWSTASGGEARTMAETALRIVAHELRMATARIEGDRSADPVNRDTADPADIAWDEALELAISRLHFRAWELEGGAQ